MKWNKVQFEVDFCKPLHLWFDFVRLKDIYLKSWVWRWSDQTDQTRFSSDLKAVCLVCCLHHCCCCRCCCFCFCCFPHCCCCFWQPREAHNFVSRVNSLCHSRNNSIKSKWTIISTFITFLCKLLKEGLILTTFCKIFVM